MIKHELLVPLLNANEPEARLAGVHVTEGQAVETRQLLFTVETTKAASEIESPGAGFIRILVNEGDILAVGDRLAVLTDTPDEPLSLLSPATASTALPVASLPGDLRITQPARRLAEVLGVDLNLLPTDRLVTEAVVRQVAGTCSKITLDLPAAQKPYLLVYGAGGHAKTIMELVSQLGSHTIAGIVDDNPDLTGIQVLGFPVLGTRDLLQELTEKGIHQAVNGVGGILEINVRVRVFELLESTGYAFPSFVHLRATVEPSARIAAGALVFANAYIGSEAILEPMCMVNTSAVVSHDCVIGRYTHIAPGALLAGHVHVGEKTLVGMGVTSAIGVKIGNGVRIGNAAKILADVPDRTIIQAGRFWVGKVE